LVRKLFSKPVQTSSELDLNFEWGSSSQLYSFDFLVTLPPIHTSILNDLTFWFTFLYIK